MAATQEACIGCAHEDEQGVSDVGSRIEICWVTSWLTASWQVDGVCEVNVFASSMMNFDYHHTVFSSVRRRTSCRSLDIEEYRMMDVRPCDEQYE